MPPDPPSGSRLQHLRAPPLILPLLRHCETTTTPQGNNVNGCSEKVQSYILMKFKDIIRVSAKTLMLSYFLATRSDKPDDPETPVHVGTPLVAPRHRWRDLLRALTAP